MENSVNGSLPINRKAYYPWVDNIKLFACILVALGHFIMSMKASGIIKNSHIYYFFIGSIYTYHVPLFFVCSGYLYRKSNKVHTFKSWGQNISNKLLNLGVPYFVFSLITLFTKMLVPDNINTAVRTDILNVLFANPTAPYWYLYSLFLIFLIIPCISKLSHMITLFAISVPLKIVYEYLISTNIVLPFPVRTICENLIWFSLGMLLAFDVIDLKSIGAKLVSAVFLVTAVGISFYKNFVSGTNYLKEFPSAVLFVTAFIIIFNNIHLKPLNKLSSSFSKFFMPVYVMHTIFAAGIRILLFKLGITNSVIHIILGLIFSFALPVLYYKLAEKIPVLMFLIYPQKAINNIKSKHKTLKGT